MFPSVSVALFFLAQTPINPGISLRLSKSSSLGFTRVSVSGCHSVLFSGINNLLVANFLSHSPFPCARTTDRQIQNEFCALGLVSLRSSLQTLGRCHPRRPCT